MMGETRHEQCSLAATAFCVVSEETSYGCKRHYITCVITNLHVGARLPVKEGCVCAF